MIVPSIDLMDGQAVQLVQGRRKVLDAGDPRPIAERFGRVGEVAVVDLDAALGRGSNTAVIEELCRLAPCRVGGGIRDRDTALEWLNRGAVKVVLGTAAVPEVLEGLPRDRVVAALDAWEGEVVVKGWTERTGRTVYDGMRELRGLAGGFLVTFVEGRGRRVVSRGTRLPRWWKRRVRRASPSRAASRPLKKSGGWTQRARTLRSGWPCTGAIWGWPKRSPRR